MTWSTRELADLAGTTLNTVRYYHQIGLLEEPSRAANGYKQYKVAHLVRLLEIRRLRELGVPLELIEDAGSEGQTSMTALEAVDADLAASIQRLERARREIRSIIDSHSVADVPPGWESARRKLSPTERSLTLIYAQLYDSSAMSDLREMFELEPDDASVAFDRLDPDADEETRRELADAYSITISRHLRTYPWLTDPQQRLRKSPRMTRDAFLEAVRALYNPAQLDVIGRAGRIAHDRVTQESGPAAEA